MKQKSIIKTLFLLPVLGLLTGCATIFLGPKQEVNINSDPPGAQVVLSGQESSYTTPCRMEVKRKVKESSFNQKNENVYVFKKEGYEDATFSVNLLPALQKCEAGFFLLKRKTQ